MREVVVAGGSIAALTAVETLRMLDFDGRITVLSDEALPPYTRVPLSKGVLAGRDSTADVVLAPLADEVDLHLRTPVLGLDLEARTVSTPDGPLRYDGLVIATGARARRLGAPDQDERVLRTLDDAQRLRRDLGAASSVLIVGGGFLGMEVASTAVELGKDVTVVDVDRPLTRLLGEHVGAFVCQVAERRGVRIVRAVGAVSLVGAPDPHGVRLSDGTTLEADLVVSAVGDVANVEWLAGSGIAAPGGVRVDEYCRAAPGVVAAGDVALTVRRDDTLVRVPSWTNAVEQARAAAQALLLGEAADPYRPSHYHWTEQFDLDIKVVGDGAPCGVPAVLDGLGLADSSPSSALLAWPDAASPRQLVAVNHHTPPARLKRMLRSGGVRAS